MQNIRRYIDTQLGTANPHTTGIKAKVENQEQYKQYLDQLEGLRQELGVALREELYPQEE